VPELDLLVRARRIMTPDGVRQGAVGVQDGRIIAVVLTGRPAAGRAAQGAAGLTAQGAADLTAQDAAGLTGQAAGDLTAQDAGDLTAQAAADLTAQGAAGLTAQGAAGLAAQSARETVDLADDEVLMPGLVDTHVHVNEPGRTDWEGFATATRAAAAGGVTTIIDMPLNSVPPTISVAALRVKQAAARGQIHVDVGFWGGAVPGNAAQRPPLQAAGVFGFKCFTVDSGVPEFPPLDNEGLLRAARQAARIGGLLLVHAEDAAIIGGAPPPAGSRYAGFLRSRPRAAETAAVAAVIEAVRRSGARTHVLHLSSADAVPLVAAARRDGLAITVETCPHYLALTAEDVPDGATQFKCCPPIRERANRELLWDALSEGIIDCVVSDHSPCPPELKQLEQGDFAAAWGGISSLQIALPVLWTQARARGHSLADVARWMAVRPAEIAGLPRKGMIAPGRDADLVVFAPDESFVVEPAKLRHRHQLTPYAGQTLQGVVRRTWLRGTPVSGDRPAGRLLAREETEK
jgi:allantoinase